MTIHVQIPPRARSHDAEFACRFPRLGEDKKDKEAYQSIEFDATASQLVRSCCSLYETTPALVLAAIWAATLCSFTEGERVKFALFQKEVVHGERCAQGGRKHVRAESYATLIDRETQAGALMKQENWEVLPHVAGDRCLNTGLYMAGEAEVEFATILKGIDICIFCRPASLGMTLIFSSKILPQTFARAIASAVPQGLQHILRYQTITIGEIDLFSQTQEELVKAWQGGEPTQTQSCFLFDFLSRQAVERPDAVAIDAWDGRWTYRELDEISTILASHLQTCGVQSGTLVTVCFEKTCCAVVALLAVNKAGGGFVPCDPAYPAERREKILQQAGSTLILTSAKCADLFAGPQTPAVMIISTASLSKLQASPYRRPVDGDAPGYVLFTSGSTGEPKGCEVSHTAFASISNHVKPLHLGPACRALQFASFSFGMAIIEIFCTLMAGGTVCMLSDEQRLNTLAATMTEMKTNWALMTPTVLGSLQPHDLPHLKCLLVAGEALNEAQIQIWSPVLDIFQAYGLTEWTGIFAVSKRIASIQQRRTIGVPANGQAWLVDPSDPHKLVPVGAVGELVIRGPGLASGYYQAPERTKASFLSPQWLTRWNYHSGSRIYRTGDIMRYNVDGSLSYVRRADNQVKIRGMRVELNEVEYHLMQLVPDAKRVVAMLWKPQERDGQQVLLALAHMGSSPESKPAVLDSTDGQLLFLQPTADKRRTIDNALEQLHSRLPDYMIPQYLLALAAFPTTVTGKVDRRKLLRLVNGMTTDDLQRLAGRKVGHQAPVTESERQVYDLACTVLGVKSISMNDNFFDLAGDSVAAMKLAGLARRRKIQLTVADVFNRPVLKDLASATRQLNGTTTSQSVPFGLIDAAGRPNVIQEAGNHMDAARIVDIYPCTPLQEGIWALSMRNHTLYRARVICRLRPDVDLNRFRTAWERVFELNDILRTRLFSTPTGLYQAVLRESFEWDAAQNLQTYLHRVDQEHMGVGNRLVRACLLPDTDQASFVLTVHHALCDRWSLRLLLEQIEKQLSLAPPSTHHAFSPFIEHLASIAPQFEKFWVDQFQGHEASPFPALPSPDYTPTAHQISRLNLRLPRRALRKKTLASHLRLAWALVISQNTCSDDIVFGSTVTGRGANVSGIETLSGPTIATVPFRTSLNPAGTIAEALAATQEQSISMMPFEQVGLQKIQRYSPEAESACMFQSTLTVQPGWPNSLTLFTDCQEGAATAGGFASYALCIECYPDSEETQLDIQVAYDANVVPPTRTGRLMDHFGFVLHQIMEDPHRTIREVQHMMSPADLIQLGRWNAIIPLQPQQTVHGVVQFQAKKTPHAPAISSLDGDLTYQALDMHSTQLAGELLLLGARPGMLIPLLFEKSRWAIVAMLAVLKVGGGIVALDPSYPVDRMRAICAQVQSALGICSERHASTLEQIVSKPIIASEISDIWNRPLEGLHLPTVGADATMYLIFTSGSTGVPKGVIVNHDCFVSSTLAYRAEIHLNAESRLLQFCSFAFDVCFAEIFGTLMAGACLCIPSDADRMNDIHHPMRKLHVTHAFFTPSYARLVQPEQVPSLRVVMLAGEPVKASDVEHWAPHVHLVNGYGPSECAPISATQYLDGSANVQPQDIGHPRGCVAWVCDPQDHDTLLPIGATGELVIEGPNVGPGYFQNASDTIKAFVEAPRWLQRFRGRTNKLVYKTKDLVHFTEDGRLRYVGRIGQQAKLRGQRLEPSHVEHHLLQAFDGAVEVAAIVATAKDAGGRANLVGFVLSANAKKRSGEGICLPASEQFCLLAAAARSRLQQSLPEFMIPSLIIPVSSMPRTPSGKLDRQQLTREITSRTWDELMEFEASERPSHTNVSDTEKELQTIWSRVLNLPVSAIGNDKSFFQLGGDSITAILVVAQARACPSSLQLTVEDIFRLRTISQIAAHINTNSSDRLLLTNHDALDVPFDLSPIQQLFFDTNWPQQQSRFNHNLLLHLKYHVSFGRLKLAMHHIVEEHPLLRARFLKNADGQWQQLIPSEIEGSYGCRHHQLTSADTMQKVLVESRGSLDISSGPVFSADLIEIGGNQSVFLLAHHLVIDMVSWTVLLADLETLLHGKSIPKGHSTSFQTWCNKLAAYGHKTLSEPPELPFYGALEDFWGISDGLNTMGGAHDMVIQVDTTTTEALLGEANKAYGTQPVELLHAAVLFAFATAFPDRPAPVIFSEGHGRESWDSSTDLTRTVGWFTTIAPVHVKVDATHDIVAVVRQVKDTRRRLRKNGLEAFTAEYFNTKKQRRTPAGKMEIVFNYGGRYHQQLGQAGSLFEVESLQKLSIFDAADDARRWSMVDINAFVQDGQLVFTFTYPKSCNVPQVLLPWTASLRKCLDLIASGFSNLARGYTLADFPMLDLDYSQLDHLLQTLQHANIRPDDVEEIYPCSPMQRGILLSQAKDPSCYHVVMTWEIVSGEKKPASAERAKAAIEEVIARHASLRTCFIETTSEVAAFDQVVLRKPHHQISISNSRGQGAKALLQRDKFQPSPHSPLRFSIYVSCDQRVYIRLDVSHALIDAKSIDLLKRDICLAYENQLCGVGPLFSNYISFIQTRDPVADAEFWDKYLDGIQPCQFPGLTEQANTEPGVAKDYVFDVAGAHGIETYCQNRNVTAPNVFGLAWALVLASYTASQDVCFGYLNSGRELPFEGAPGVVGLLVNMLTMRVNFNDATIEQLVQQVHADYAAGLAHQTYPVADIFHRKGLSGRSLFNTGISVERVVGPQTVQSSTELRLVQRVDPTEYDIVLNVEIEQSRTVVHLRYWSSCLSDSQATLIGACFDQTVAMIINDDQAPASSANLFCQAHQDLVWRWNKELPSFHDGRVHDIVQKQATLRPDASAVCSSDGTLTYRDLDAHSTALAHYLSQHGVGTEMFVPLCFEKGMWTAVAILAVLKTGAGFVLLDAGHPDQRLETICQDVGGPLLLSSPAQAERCAQFSSTVVVVGGTQDLWRGLRSSPSSQLLSAAMHTRPTNAAYAVYTSGSTGKPKGIIIEHGSFCSMIHAQAPILNMTPSARMLQFSSYAFDVSIFEMLMPLMTGGCVCVLSEVERRDRFVEAMGSLRISHALLTPSFSRLVSPTALPDLQVLVCGGEAMTQHDMERWLGHVTLINHYGPAECSVCSVVQPHIDTASRVGDIGWGVSCATWVVDPDDHERLAPIGAVGELVIEGPIVGRRYLNNPTATQIAFIEPPRWLRNLRGSLGRNNRLYKTGDLVRYGSDGRLYIHGRKDTQIKIRGQRLELQELEYHVHRCFASAGNVVVELVRNDPDGNPSLFAFVGSTKEISSQFHGFSAVGKEFRDRAAAASTELFESLPSYMVPTYFVPSVTLPLNSSGKVDRKRLRDLAAALTPDQLKNYRPSVGGKCNPSSPKEKLLHAIWVDVLGVEPDTIGADDHFFQVGGDSVNAMRVAASARKQGLSIVVADIFAHPRLAALAKAGTESNIEQFVPTPFSLSPVTDLELFSMLLRVQRTIPSESHVEDILPATAAQSFFLTRPTLHHFTFDIEGPLDVRRLHDACDKVFNAFAVLRTVFVPYENQALQVILDNIDAPFYHFVVDEPIPDVRKRLLASDRENITLLGRLVFAFVLISHSDGLRHSLSFRVSHAQWDGLSIAELFSSVQEAYHARPLTPCTPLSAYIYYRALRDKSNSLQFWKDYLQGSAITQITEPRASTDPTQGDTIWENTNLQPAPEPPLGITMASVVKSAWSLVLARETGARDIVFGQTVNSRSSPLPDIDRILGCCLNFIPARIQLQNSWTGRDLLQHAQTQYQKTVKHDDIELQEIIDHCTDWSNGTNFNGIVQHQNIPLNHTMSLGDLPSTFSPNGYFRPGPELFIFTEPFGDLLSVQLCVNPNTMMLPRAQFLHQRLVKLIVDLCRSPDEPLSRFLE